MKAVLMSINPKWCQLIASGKKTVEVRKTKPELEVPFKVYIYCTKGKDDLMSVNGKVQKLNTLVLDLTRENDIYDLNGKVIGEFVCRNIDFLKERDLFEGMDEISNSRIEEYSCLSIDELLQYKGNKEKIYGWNISDLVIYDKPRELSEFATFLSDKDIRCKHIKMRYTINGKRYNKCTLQNCVCEFRRLGHQTDCDGYEMLGKKKPITRPPQSWCYVGGQDRCRMN